MERTAYMQHLINSTEQLALLKATYDMRPIMDAWPLAIACKLFDDIYQDRNPQAFEILEATGEKAYTKETFLKAADLVLNSTLINNYHGR